MPLCTNTAIEKEYLDRGYAKVNLCSATTASALLQRLEIPPAENTFNSGFSSSIKISDTVMRVKIQEIILEVILPIVEAHFPEYTIVRASFLTKFSDALSEVPIHYDDTSCDETIDIPFHLWIPLVDTSPENGCLHVVPYSHHYTNKIRGLGLPMMDKAHLELLKASYLLATPTVLGEAVMYHPGLLHYSPPNNSGKERPAIVVACIPKNTCPIVYIAQKEIFWKKYYKLNMPIDEYVLWDEKQISNKLSSYFKFQLPFKKSSKVLKKIIANSRIL